MSTITLLATAEKVARLVKFATGEEYGDGSVVTDVIIGCAEPGHGSDESVIVLGNWGPARFVQPGDPPLTAHEAMPERLARSLKRVGAEVGWQAEWTRCQNCKRAVLTQCDSDSWRPSYAVIDHEPICGDCLTKMGEDALTQYVNNPRQFVTWCDSRHLAELGYVHWAPGDPHVYSCGWLEGMPHDPQSVFDVIRQHEPDADVIFYLDEQSEFYVRFSAFVKLPQR